MKKSILRDCLRIAVDKKDTHPERFGEFIHYSFFVQGNKFIEMGVNRSTNFSQLNIYKALGYDNQSKIHSEIDCYFKSRGHPDFDLDKPFDCINIRLNKKGEIRNSAPCSVCRENLLQFGVRNVYYTTNEGFRRLKIGELDAIVS